MPGIDLASEPPFRVGRFEVRPGTREIIAEGARLTLEPRVLQVLVVLMRKAGEVVSRDELIATCWAGRIVGQEALNRCIAALRRPGEGVFARGFDIETVPRVGYRLLVPDASADLPAASPSSLPARRLVRRLRVPMMAVLAIVAAGGLAFHLRSPAEWSLVSVDPLVVTPEAERDPAFSPDGRWVAYSAGSDGRARDVHIVRVGSPTSMRFTDEPDDEANPSWSADGRLIVYTSSRNGRPCRFRIRAFPSGLPRDAGACLVDNRASAIFAPDRRGLLVAERTSPGGTIRVLRLDLATGRRSIVTTPPADSLGDTAPSLSPDGRLLLVRRLLSDNAAELVVHDRHDGTERIVVPSQAQPANGAWLPDGSGLVYNRRENATSSLWMMPLDGDAPHRIAILASRAAGMSAGRNGQIAVEIDQSRFDVAWSPSSMSGPPSYVSPMNGRTYTPTFAPDGTMAMASNRSGRWAIWLVPPDGTARLLIPYEIGETLRWSPDGQRLAFATSASGMLMLHTVDRAGHEGPRTKVPFRATGTVTWNGDGTRLLFSGLDASGWRIYSMTPGDPASVRPVTAYGFWDVEVHGAAIYALKADRTGIWRVDGLPHAIWQERANTDLASWRLLGGDLIWIDFGVPHKRRLLARSLAGGPTHVVAETPDMADFGQFDRDPRSGRFVYVRAATYDHDLMLLQIHQQSRHLGAAAAGI